MNWEHYKEELIKTIATKIYTFIMNFIQNIIATMQTITHFNIDSDVIGTKYPTTKNIWKVSVRFAARRSFCVEFYLAIGKRPPVCHNVATHLWDDEYCIFVASQVP